MAGSYKKLHWTEHSKMKMKQYGLSVSKLLGILQRPERKEKGIVPGTAAVMRTNKKLAKTLPLFKKEAGLHLSARNWAGSKSAKAPGEIWIMYKDVKKRDEAGTRKIISAWRYPGISKPGEEIPIPEDIKNEILNLS